MIKYFCDVCEKEITGRDYVKNPLVFVWHYFRFKVLISSDDDREWVEKGNICFNCFKKAFLDKFKDIEYGGEDAEYEI